MSLIHTSLRAIRRDNLSELADRSNLAGEVLTVGTDQGDSPRHQRISNDYGHTDQRSAAGAVQFHIQSGVQP